MSPLRSATSTNVTGGTASPSQVHRASASTLWTSPVWRTCTGCRCRRTSPCARAARSADAIRWSRHSSSAMPSWKTTSRPLPSRLAAYMAVSALFRSSSAVVPTASEGSSTTPMLAATRTALPCSENGAVSAAVTASVTARTSPSSSSRTANSSPPRRATVSPRRRVLVRRSPTRIRSSSPAACPRLSLMTLKSSRSRKISETGRRSRACSSRACPSRSENSARLGSPVRGSWKARWRSSASRSASCPVSAAFSRRVRYCRNSIRPTMPLPMYS